MIVCMYYSPWSFQISLSLLVKNTSNFGQETHDILGGGELKSEMGDKGAEEEGMEDGRQESLIN